MKKVKMLQIAGLVVTLLIISCQQENKNVAEKFTPEVITEYWTSGKTLPVEVSEMYPFDLQKIEEDTGYNILIDLAHQCSFKSLWSFAPRLNNLGYRALTSHASIHSVLKPEGVSRARIMYDKENKIFPFAWIQNPGINVIITEQANSDAQEYLPKEQEIIIEFVEKGGGLIIIGAPVSDKNKLKEWSLNRLVKQFGAEFTTGTDKFHGTEYAVIDASENWEILEKGENGKVIIARTKAGMGKVVVLGGSGIVHESRNAAQEEKERIADFLDTNLAWLTEAQKQAGGEPRLPASFDGGGSFYPEIEKQFSNIVFFYAENQKEELLKTVREDIPKCKDLIESLLPTKPTAEPMYLLLCAGSGGGWAVNAFRPKENGIISLNRLGIISIFAHELAHTMFGPVNDLGEVAGKAPIPDKGEAHAGWFQGKSNATFDPDLKSEPNRNCNDVFKFDPDLKLDLKKYAEDEEYRKQFKGRDWTKIWYLWQKLDDRYGPTWYPRWKWIQHTRWKDTPEHRLTWEEMVEDMSIAVGEDLFPFFNKTGTILKKGRLTSIEFEGKVMQLEPTPIEPTPAGRVRLEAISDYKKPLQYKK